MTKKGTPRTTYPKESEAKLKEANRQLRAQVKRLKNELKETNKHVKTLQQISEKNINHIGDLMNDISLEDAIKLAKKKQKKNEPDKPAVEKVKDELRAKFSRGTDEK